MKKLTIALATLTLALLPSLVTLSQVPPPPPNPGGSPCNTNGTPVGGANAPIDNGIGILIVLASAYALRKKGQGKEDPADK